MFALLFFTFARTTKGPSQNVHHVRCLSPFAGGVPDGMSFSFFLSFWLMFCPNPSNLFPAEHCFFPTPGPQTAQYGRPRFSARKQSEYETDGKEHGAKTFHPLYSYPPILPFSLPPTQCMPDPFLRCFSLETRAATTTRSISERQNVRKALRNGYKLIFLATGFPFLPLHCSRLSICSWYEPGSSGSD